MNYKLFPNNPRFITEQEFLALAESMGDFGSLDGIVVNTSPGDYEGVVISGNQKTTHIGIAKLKPKITKRYREPTRAGTVAIGTVEYMGESFPYREVYWSADKCEIANLRANNMGGHNDPVLLERFNKQILDGAGIDIEEERARFMLLNNFLDLAPAGKGADNGKEESDGDSVEEPEVDEAEQQRIQEQYLQNNIRQFVLTYPSETYEKVVAEMERRAQEHGLKDNSQLVLKLIGLDGRNSGGSD